MKKYLCHLSLIAFYSLSFLAKPIMADSTVLSITPPVVEVMIAPNKKFSQTFNLEYSGNNLSFIPEIHTVKPLDQNGHALINPEPLNPSTIPLIVTSNHEFGKTIVPSGTTIPITLTFEAASTDIVEDVYLALVVQAATQNNESTSSAATPAISALILVTINPNGVMPINLDIEKFESPTLHDSRLPLTITPEFVNKIPIMIRPTGRYEVISPSGKIVFTLPLYPNLLLGDSNRAILGQVKEGDKATPAVPLTWNPSWKNIGPHRLHLTIETQGGTKITDIEKVVWVLPIRLLLTIILILLLIIFIAWKNRPKTQINP